MEDLDNINPRYDFAAFSGKALDYFSLNPFLDS
jgi:hypothetical protein